MLHLDRSSFKRAADSGGGGGGGRYDPKEDESPLDPLLQQIYDGKLTSAQLAHQLIAELYEGVRDYCQIPEKYRDCKFEAVRIEDDLKTLTGDQIKALKEASEGRIINPSPKQLMALALFQAIESEDPRFCDGTAAIPCLSPTVGAYLLGQPGCGKTHIMAAFAMKMKATLDAQLEEFKAMATRILASKFASFLSDAEKEDSEIGKKAGVINLDDLRDGDGNIDLSKDVFSKGTNHGTEIHEGIAQIRRFLRSHQARPTAILFVEFDKFFEDYSRAETADDAAELIHRICEADYVFVDDMHPKGDPKRAQLIQHFIERRYHTGKFGTFITSNVEVGDLTNVLTGFAPGHPATSSGEAAHPVVTDMLSARLGSRASEILIEINIDDAQDWRMAVHGKRLEFLSEVLVDELAKKMAADIASKPGVSKKTIQAIVNSKTFNPFPFEKEA